MTSPPYSAYLDDGWDFGDYSVYIDNAVRTSSYAETG